MAAVFQESDAAFRREPKPAPGARAGVKPRRSALGKYREIVIAAALLVLFGIGELVLNFSPSLKADADTADVLRMVHAGGIVLALLVFAFTVSRLLIRLQESDAAIAAAAARNRDILSSVREGVFVLAPGSKIGTQLSRSVHALFGAKLAPGDDFFELLAPLVPGHTLADTRDYVDLLFAAHVKEALIEGMNPLAEVEMTPHDRGGDGPDGPMPRHLSFQFNRAQDAAGVRHLLVTVQDISERMALAAQLQEESRRSQKEFAMLLKAFDADPAVLRQFVLRAETGLLEVNDMLRSGSDAQGENALLRTLDEACRRIHALKGDASTLGLDTLAGQAHQFESELQRVRRSGGGAGAMGEALLALPLPLEDLLAKVSALKGLTGIQRSGTAEAAGGEAINEALARLAQDVAADGGKRLQATVRMGSQSDLDAATRDLVREIAVQLTRNAVVHGIETPAARTAAGKDAQGQVEIQLTRTETDWTLSVRDDGIGLSAARIRQKLIELNWYNAAQLDNFNERQVIAHIFKPGFSTAGALSPHAGRGIGLDVVQANVQRLGARMMLTSTPGQSTEFKIRFAA